MALTPKQEAFATGLASGMSQSAAYRKAYPKARLWRDNSVYKHSSEMAAHPKVCARVAELGSIAAAANEITVERVVRELAKVAFGDTRKLMKWGPDGVLLTDSDTIDEADAASVSEVSETKSKDGGSIKLKKHDKVKALELLGKHVGAFETDNRQRNPMGSFDAGKFFGDIFRRPGS